MTSRRDRDIIAKIMEYCDEIADTISFFGNSYEAFTGSKIYRNAAAMCVLQIGELAGHLSGEFRAMHSEMPWQDMKAMRNVAAHHYGKFDPEMLWGTVTKNIPVLYNYCAGL